MERKSKNGFISLYVLLILLVFALTISFIYRENESNFDNAENLYNKKVAMFEAESFLNILIEENRVDEKNRLDTGRYQEILNSFKSNSKISIHREEANNKVKEADGAMVLNIRAVYKNTESHAIMVYKVDENKKFDIKYKKVY